MDIGLPLPDASCSYPFSYPPHSSQTATHCLPGAASTSVVDYADTPGNHQRVQTTTDPSLNTATTTPISKTTSWPCHDPALLARLAEMRISPREQPKIDCHIATTNIRAPRKKRLGKVARAKAREERRESIDGLNATATISIKADKPTVGFGFTGRSDVTATSSQLNDSGRSHLEVPEQFPDSASWASLKAQALKNRAKIGKLGEQLRNRKKTKRPRDLPKRLAELEKQITTLRHSGPSSITLEKKITHITRQALSVRVRIEEGEGRLTVREAKALRVANARMLSRKTKKTDHEKGVENLVDQVAMLL
ncbi:hypothetical protein MMC17_007624 [Xylographa soralifera]|nr:hypothetical protein [Xylographa soralifera]